MSLPEKSALISPPKIKRFADTTHIHNLFVFNKTGICLFRVNFTDSYKIKHEQLISSFFTALMSFTKELIGNKIRALEMGDVKFVIIESSLFYYGLLCETLENIILLEDIVAKINRQILEYVNKNDINISFEHFYDEDLDKIVCGIINETLSKEFDFRKEDELVAILKDVIHDNDEISGCVLLTDKGKVIHTSFDKIYLRNFLKEVNFRVKICNNSILKMFYTSKEGELIFSEYVEDLYVVILVFDIDTKFGLAEYYLQKIVKNIKKILNN